MNIFYYIILILIVIFIILINIKNIIIEKFICINPELINNNGTCINNFFIGYNSNSEEAQKICNNNDNCNGYSIIKYNLNNNIGYINFKCLDNWDGKIIYDNDKSIYNKLINNNIKNKDNIDFSDLKTYKCNKTCPPGKGIKDNTFTCKDCDEDEYNNGDSHLCRKFNTKCDIGYLKKKDNKTGIVNCIKCLPGTFNTGDSDICKPHKISCEYGEELVGGSNTEDKTCKYCRYGYYSDGKNCIKIEAGYKIKADKSGQELCPTGTYSTGGKEHCTLYKFSCEYGQKLVGGSKIEDKTCENCPDGYYSDGKNCTKVEAGYKRKADKSGQEPCIPGTYSRGGTNDCMGWSSSICSAGQKLSGGSNTEDRICVECPDGYYSKGIFTTCIIVDPGYKRTPGKSTQIPCPTGSYSPGGTNNCTPCPNETYSSSLGSTTCTDWTATTCPSGQKLVGGSNKEDQICVSCPPGEFSPGNTSRICTKVQSGYQIKEDKSGEEICPKGTFSKGGENICTSCPNGQYSSNAGSSNCTPVSPGYKRKPDKTGQLPCPDGKYSGGSTNDCNDCACPNNQYTPDCGGDKKGTCINCPNCGIGRYRSGCSGINSGMCSLCHTCPGYKYRPSCGGTNPGTCVPCPSCPHGYVISNCSFTNPGTCQKIPQKCTIM